MHPAQQRSWLQTGGLPVDPIHADLRAEFDRVHHVTWIGGGCFRLQDDTGRQVGLVQFQGANQVAVDQAVMATTERLAVGEPKPTNIAAGDTVIRPLNMADPVDRELAANAVTGVADGVVVPDNERQDPPPIDLPDYDGPRASRDPAAAEKPAWRMRVLVILVAVVAFAATIAAVIGGRG